MKQLFALGRIFKSGQKQQVNQQDLISIAQVTELVEKIKQFNAGVIDQFLSKHVDETFENWLKQIKEE